jgi:flagellar protein FlaG
MQISRFTPYESLAASFLAGAASPTAPVQPLNAVQKPVNGTQQDEGTIVGDVPPAPTPEAREMVDRAAERVQELVKQNRELHFSRDEQSNRVVIEVRDLEGNVLKTIPPAKALDVMSGADL